MLNSLDFWHKNMGTFLMYFFVFLSHSFTRNLKRRNVNELNDWRLCITHVWLWNYVKGRKKTKTKKKCSFLRPFLSKITNSTLFFWGQENQFSKNLAFSPFFPIGSNPFTYPIKIFYRIGSLCNEHVLSDKILYI